MCHINMWQVYVYVMLGVILYALSSFKELLHKQMKINAYNCDQTNRSCRPSKLQNVFLKAISN